MEEALSARNSLSMKLTYRYLRVLKRKATPVKKNRCGGSCRQRGNSSYIV
jgi:hypothetical protein